MAPVLLKKELSSRALPLVAGLVAAALGAGMVIALLADSEDSPDPGRFSTVIDNPYLPLVPGTVMRYREVAEGEEGSDVVRVTRRTKVIQGVTTLVVRDKAYVEGELVEDTYDWYAQDDAGNVWYFGENTKEYDNGKVVSTEGSWIAGRDGAKAGIVMKAEPRVGDTYYQEDAPAVAEDQATVLSLDQTVDVPYGSFSRVWQTKDFTELDRSTVEHKFYARGVGLVFATLVKGGDERLELLSVETGN